VEGLHSLRDVAAVGGQVVGDGDELSKERQRGNEEEGSECKDDAKGGDGTREPKAFEEGDDGGEEKSEEDGKSKGKREDFCEIEDGDAENRDGGEPELG